MIIKSYKEIMFLWHLRISFFICFQYLLEVQSIKSLSDDSFSKPEVIIIGAGASGIAAAQVLYEARINFLLMEADNEIGGRMKSHKFGQYIVENGANWIQGLHSEHNPSINNPIWDFRNEYGIRGNVTDWDDYSMRTSNGDEVDYYTVDKWWEKFENTTSSCFKEGLRLHENSKKEKEKTIEDISVEECFNRHGYGPNYPSNCERLIGETLKFYELESDDTIPSSNKSLMFGAIEYNNGLKYNEDFYFITEPRGYSIFLKEISKPFMDSIRFGHEVVAINHNDNEVKVKVQIMDDKYIDDGLKQRSKIDTLEINAKYAISTLPLGVLQKGKIKFSPPLSKNKQESIQKMKMGHYAKIYFQFPYAFWGQDEVLLILDESNLGLQSMALNLNHPKYFPGSNMLTIHFVGDDAVRIESQNPEKTKSEIMQLLRGAFHGSIPNPILMHVTNWTHNSYSYGSYSAIPIGFTLNMWEELRKNAGRLYFSGEHTAEKFHATVHGAFETGKITAAKVLEEIKTAKVKPRESVKGVAKDKMTATDLTSLASIEIRISHRLMTSIFCLIVFINGISILK